MTKAMNEEGSKSMSQNRPAQNLSRRAFLRGTVGVMGIATLAACAPTVQPSAAPVANADGAAAEGTTTLWWYSHGGALGELMERFAADFSAASEGVIIQPEFQGGYEELMNKLIVSAAASTLPDLIHVGDGQYSPLARAGILLPLDDLINGPDGLDLADYFSPIERVGWMARCINSPMVSARPSSITTQMYWRVLG
jgi:ABC-type glycerol-3-phosphate transport system substrate-binding protein